MAKRLTAFPWDQSGRRRYPWDEWADGGVWEIRQGKDYDVPTENMRVNLHLKADALGSKARTKKVQGGTGLIFQFVDSEEGKILASRRKQDPDRTARALQELYADACEIYERARAEVRIERKDGRFQRYAAIRFKRQIDSANEQGKLPQAVARITKKRTLGFGHLAKAGRRDLMLETLVVDPKRQYHELFSPTTVRIAQERLAELK
jgi:hypothetical protein